MTDDNGKQLSQDFVSQASRRESTNPVIEFWHYLRYSDKWWLAPIVITMLGLGLLVFLAGTGAAPFIYTVF